MSVGFLLMVLSCPSGWNAPAQAQAEAHTEAATGEPQGSAGIEFFTPDPSEAAEFVAETTVGMRVEMLELVIPGAAVQATPVADPGRADALVRIKHEYTHGSGFRYDLEFTPFIEGEFDLRDFLERKDGTSLDDAPALPILVEAVLDPEVLQPKDPDVPHPASVGGYRNLLIGGGIAWFVGLLALLFAFRRRPEMAQSTEGAVRMTLADRLRPLVEAARSSELSSERRAELERLLLAHWRKRRGLLNTPAAEAVAALRADDEAGPLFRQLEAWLHRPAGDAGSSVDVAELLAPYRDVAADRADLPGSRGA